MYSRPVSRPGTSYDRTLGVTFFTGVHVSLRRSRFSIRYPDSPEVVVVVVVSSSAGDSHSRVTESLRTRPYVSREGAGGAAEINRRTVNEESV